MIKRIFFFSAAVLAFLLISGCAPDGDGAPQIIGPAEHTFLKPAPNPVPVVVPDKPSYISRPTDKTIPAGWYPPKNRQKRWKAIIIHHSKTHRGNAESFDKYHKDVKHWKGIGYDFVIGNGNGNRDGRVEVTFRWKKQIAGAHVGGTPNNWANEKAIGICLVGDFTKTRPSSRQMRSLAKLVRFLQNRYKIPRNRIYGHNTTPGTQATDCPGKYFPMARLKSTLEF